MKMGIAALREDSGEAPERNRAWKVCRKTCARGALTEKRGIGYGTYVTNLNALYIIVGCRLSCRKRFQQC